MRLALCATDTRETWRQYDRLIPEFETATEALIEGFATTPELEVHVVSCSQRPMRSPEKLAPNIWFHGLWVPKSGWLRMGYAGCVRATRRKLAGLRPDIVHAQGTERDCAIRGLLSGFPNVLTIHGNMRQLWRQRTLPLFYRSIAAALESYILPRTDGVFCNSTYTEKLIARRARRFWRVPNPMRSAFLAPRLKPPESPPVLLNIGSILKYKQPLELLEALAKLYERGRKFRLLFAGALAERNPYCLEFKQRISMPPFSDFASYAGFLSRDELLSYYDRASALVHVCSVESFGLAVSEAFARNLKVFGFAGGGVLDVAEGVDGGELVGIDQWDELISRIDKWLLSGAPLPAFAADEMRRRYAPEVIARRHVEIYREVLDDRASAPAARALAS